MFNIFKRKTKAEKLQQKYNKLMKMYFNLSKTNRKEAEKYYVEAEEIMKKINSL